MKGQDLFTLVQKAKSGDKEAVNQIILMVQPFIQKVCRRAPPNERNDLQQHLTEKVIVAVKNYDMNSIPSFSQFVNLISSNYNQSALTGAKDYSRTLVE